MEGDGGIFLGVLMGRDVLTKEVICELGACRQQRIVVVGAPVRW